jgi:hypothetical protein
MAETVNVANEFAVDVYAFAVTMFELWTGLEPYADMQQQPWYAVANSGSVGVAPERKRLLNFLLSVLKGSRPKLPEVSCGGSSSGSSSGGSSGGSIGRPSHSSSDCGSHSSAKAFRSRPLLSGEGRSPLAKEHGNIGSEGGGSSFGGSSFGGSGDEETTSTGIDFQTADRAEDDEGDRPNCRRCDTKCNSTQAWRQQGLSGSNMAFEQLSQRSGVPPRIIKLITRCWADNPSDRPTFDDISCELDAILVQYGHSPFFNSQDNQDMLDCSSGSSGGARGDARGHAKVLSSLVLGEAAKVKPALNALNPVLHAALHEGDKAGSGVYGEEDTLRVDANDSSKGTRSRRHRGDLPFGEVPLSRESDVNDVRLQDDGASESTRRSSPGSGFLAKLFGGKSFKWGVDDSGKPAGDGAGLGESLLGGQQHQAVEQHTPSARVQRISNQSLTVDVQKAGVDEGPASPRSPRSGRRREQQGQQSRSSSLEQTKVTQKLEQARAQEFEDAYGDDDEECDLEYDEEEMDDLTIQNLRMLHAGDNEEEEDEVEEDGVQEEENGEETYDDDEDAPEVPLHNALLDSLTLRRASAGAYDSDPQLESCCLALRQLDNKLEPDKKLPEWVMEQTQLQLVDMRDEVQLLFSVIAKECCTPSTCPKLSAGPSFCYTCKNQGGGSSECHCMIHGGARAQVTKQLHNVERLLGDALAQDMGGSTEMESAGFDKMAVSTAQHIFEVYAHLYHAHLKHVARFGMTQHLNSCFKRFAHFVLNSGLLPLADMGPLQGLVQAQWAGRGCWWAQEGGSASE